MASFPNGFYWPDYNKHQEEFVFYHQASGELLIINILGKFILDTLYKQAHSEKALELLTCQFFEIKCDDDITSAIHSTLGQFNTLGIIMNKDLNL